MSREEERFSRYYWHVFKVETLRYEQRLAAAGFPPGDYFYEFVDAAMRRINRSWPMRVPGGPHATDDDYVTFRTYLDVVGGSYKLAGDDERLRERVTRWLEKRQKRQVKEGEYRKEDKKVNEV